MSLIYQPIVRGKAAFPEGLGWQGNEARDVAKPQNICLWLALAFMESGKAPVAQRIEHQTSNLGVAGSSPAGRTIFRSALSFSSTRVKALATTKPSPSQ